MSYPAAKAVINIANNRKTEISVDKIPLNVFSDQLTITGKVNRQDIFLGYSINQMVYHIPDGLTSIKYDKYGKFAFTIELSKAYNNIDIVGVDKAKNITRVDLEVYSATKIILQIGNKIASVNNHSSLLGDPPYLKNSTIIMVPIRFLAEQLGIIVEYFPANREIKMAYNEYTIWLIVGKKEAWIHEIGQVGNTRFIFETPSEIKNGRTFIPIKFITETFEFTLQYDSKTQQIILTNEAKE